jgi:asparagine synthase (glutamine-hydrolysing)
VASLAAYGGRWGIGGRGACVRLLTDGLLPEAIIERRDKAYFNASRFGAATAEFVQTWDGNGLDDDLVDADVLRELWSAEFVPAPTAMLLQ